MQWRISLSQNLCEISNFYLVLPISIAVLYKALIKYSINLP